MRLVEVMIVAIILCAIVLVTLPDAPVWFFLVLGFVANLIVPEEK